MSFKQPDSRNMIPIQMDGRTLPTLLQHIDINFKNSLTSINVGDGLEKYEIDGQIFIDIADDKDQQEKLDQSPELVSGYEKTETWFSINSFQIDSGAGQIKIGYKVKTMTWRQDDFNNVVRSISFEDSDEQFLTISATEC